ncbi:MAG: hypothetical protein MJA84_16155, partial [Firmicutes bacterium]|nr:hypothetical protein [Bacillota bacterium]
LDGLDRGAAAEQMRSIARLVRVNPESLGDQLDMETVNTIVDTVQTKYVDFDPVRQAWTIMFLPNRVSAPESAARFNDVFELALRSDDPMVRLAYLITHVVEPTDAAITDAIRHENEVISAFGRAWRTALQQRKEAMEQAERDAAAEGDAAQSGTAPARPGVSP